MQGRPGRRRCRLGCVPARYPQLVIDCRSSARPAATGNLKEAVPGFLVQLPLSRTFLSRWHQQSRMHSRQKWPQSVITISFGRSLISAQSSRYSKLCRM